MFYIYQIKNTVTSKVYVGSTAYMGDRFSAHRRHLELNKHHSIKLQRSYNIHGKNNFQYSILEKVNSREELILNEQKWIDKCNSYFNGYNSCPIAGSQYGYKWSDESRAKLSKSKKGKPSNRKGAVLSEETKKKLSDINKGKKIPQYVIDKLKGRRFTLSAENKRAISVSRGLKNYYTIIDVNMNVTCLNMFKDYCSEKNINFKVLHGWSKKNSNNNIVHPKYKIKILKLTVND